MTYDTDEHDDMSIEQPKEQLREWEDSNQEALERQLRDRDYYDGNQWAREETDAHAERGQPTITYNRIAPKVNYVLGTEIERRVKPRAYPRTPFHELDAEAATDAIRFVADMDDIEGKHSAVSSDVMVEGIGAIEIGLDTEDPRPDSKISSEYIPFSRVFYDPNSSRPDFSDAEYMGYWTWLPLKEAQQKWPEEADEIEMSVNMEITDDDVGERQRRKWYRRDRKEIQIVKQFYRAPHEGRMEWFECLYIGGGWLEEPAVVKYVDDRGRTWCPQLMTSGYVMQGNAYHNERYGIVRNLIGPQDEINHRHSKSIHLLHAQRIMFETGALLSPEEVQGELMKPDGKIEVSRGKMKDGAVQILDNSAVTNSHVALLQDAKNEIDQVGPRPIPTAEGGAKVSGRLFIAQQEAGSMELRPVFDNLRRHLIRVYTCYWYLIRQTWTEDKWFSVRDPDDDQDYRFVYVNRPMPRGERLEELLEKQIELSRAMKMVYGIHGHRLLKAVGQLVQQQVQQQMMAAQQAGQQLPQPTPQQLEQMIVQHILQDPISAEKINANDIASVDVDIIIETSSNSIIVEHEQFQELVGMIRQGLLPLDKEVLTIVLEASSLPRKSKLIAMLNKGPTPQEQQQQEQQAQIEQAQVQQQLQLLAAQVAKLQADAQKSAAQAALTGAKAQATQLDAGLTQAQTVATQTQAQLNQANAELMAAKAEIVPYEGQLKHAQAVKAASDAEAVANGPPGQE